MGDRSWTQVSLLWPTDLPDPSNIAAMATWMRRHAEDDTPVGVLARTLLDLTPATSAYDPEAGWLELTDEEANYGVAAYSETLAACRDLGIAYRAENAEGGEYPACIVWKPGLDGEQERTLVQGVIVIGKAEIVDAMARHPADDDALHELLAYLASPTFDGIARPTINRKDADA